MTLEQQAKQYWTLASAYRRGPSLIERTMAIQIDIPTFYGQATHPHINAQLSNIMSQEGITHGEDQSANPRG